jgi:hypothetical protein
MTPRGAKSLAVAFSAVLCLGCPAPEKTPAPRPEPDVPEAPRVEPPPPLEVFVVGEYRSTERLDSDVFLRRLDEKGQIVEVENDLIANGTVAERFPVGVLDGQGGLIVVYEAHFDDGTVDVAANRVDPFGRYLWDENKLVLGTAGLERRPVPVPDGLGGAIVFAEQELAGDTNVVAARIDVDGNLSCWGGEEVLLVAASTRPESAPRAVSDGAGGAIVVFQAMNEDGNWDILAQRVDRDGNLLWADGTFVVTTRRDEVNPQLVSDGQGGAIVVCEHILDGGDVDLLSQRVSPHGQLLWHGGATSTVVASTTLVEVSPAAVADGHGGVVVAFEVTLEDGDTGIYAQRIDERGELVYQVAGASYAIVLDTTARAEHTAHLCALPDGGVIVVSEQVADVSNSDLVAQRLSPTGQLVWEEGQRVVTVASSLLRETSPRVVAAADGSAMVVYEILAEEGDHDLFVALISAEGLVHDTVLPVIATLGEERAPTVFPTR